MKKEGRGSAVQKISAEGIVIWKLQFHKNIFTVKEEKPKKGNSMHLEDSESTGNKQKKNLKYPSESTQCEFSWS